MRSTVANVLGAEYDYIFETCLARAVLPDDFNARVRWLRLKPAPAGGLPSHGGDRR